MSTLRTRRDADLWTSTAVTHLLEETTFTSITPNVLCVHTSSDCPRSQGTTGAGEGDQQVLGCPRCGSATLIAALLHARDEVRSYLDYSGSEPEHSGELDVWTLHHGRSKWDPAWAFSLLGPSERDALVEIIAGYAPDPEGCSPHRWSTFATEYADLVSGRLCAAYRIQRPVRTPGPYLHPVIINRPLFCSYIVYPLVVLLDPFAVVTYDNLTYPLFYLNDHELDQLRTEVTEAKESHYNDATMWMATVPPELEMADPAGPLWLLALRWADAAQFEVDNLDEAVVFARTVVSPVVA